MTKEELKQEAEAEADKVIIGSGMDRASVIHLKHLLVTMYIQGATEVTKELEKENAELNLKVIDLENDREIFLSDFYCDKKGTCKLTKATEIIKKLYTVYYDPCVTESDLKYRDELFAEIKQFLSEVEK